MGKKFNHIINFEKAIPKNDQIPVIRAKDSSWLCTLAHNDEETLKQLLPQRGYTLTKFFDIDDMQCYIANHPEGQVLVFRESEMNWADWLRNADHKPIELPSGKKAHGGFSKILLKTFDEINKYTSDKELFITGFSQGADLAIIFYDIFTDYYNKKGTETKASVIAFEPAQPARENLCNRCITIINGNSIISRLPGVIDGFRSQHSGTIVYFMARLNLALKNPKRIIKLIDFFYDTVEDLVDYVEKNDYELDHSIFVIQKKFEKQWDRRISKWWKQLIA